VARQDFEAAECEQRFLGLGTAAVCDVVEKGWKVEIV
jgi:hypothetical protein